MKNHPLVAFASCLTLWLILTGAACLRAHAAKGPILDFDWSMPDRFGLDANGDGLVDYFTTLDQIAPKDWTVNFVITSAPTDAKNFEISVNGVTRLNTTQKNFPLTFPNEDTYEVRITTLTGLGLRLTTFHSVVVQDWLIVGLGDSYASGEGNPDIPIAGHLFDDYNRTSQTLETFKAQLAGAVQVATTKQNDYNALLAQTARVRAAQQAYNSAVASQHAHCDKEACTTDPIFHKTVCVPAPDTDCPGAIANSAAKLTALYSQMALLGLQKTLSDIAGRLAQLESAALLAFQAAQAAVTNLQANIAQAQSDLQNIQAQAKPVWQDASAHRSAWSGQARAALRLEKSDRKTSVTFIHLAESGGVIADVINQLSQLNVGGREIDGIIMSAGGNDARFGPIVQSLIKFRRSDQTGPPQNDLPGEGVSRVQALCGSVPLLGDCGIPDYFGGINESAATMFAAALPTLAPRYRILDDRLQKFTAFGTSDILDIASLATHLVNDSTAPATQVRQRLSSALRTALTTYVQSGTPSKSATKVRSDLTTELQRIISSSTPVFDANALSSPLFVSSDVALALANPTGSSRLRLNHLLLAEAFPLDIRRPARPITTSTRVYITEYPDAAGSDDGLTCTATPSLPGVETPEWLWIANTMLPNLNKAVQNGANAQGWRFVTGIHAAFHTHGICAADSWFNNITDTLTHQGDIFGIAHPDRAGHEAYADAITAALRADLYPGGQARAPRPVAVDMPPPTLKSGFVHFPTPTAFGRRYQLQYKSALTEPTWRVVAVLVGDGEDLNLTDTHVVSRTGFYRVVVE